MEVSLVVAIVVLIYVLLVDKGLVAYPTLPWMSLIACQVLASRPPPGWTSAQSLTFIKIIITEFKFTRLIS